MHKDGTEVWTIDSDANSAFPAMPLGVQLYSPGNLRLTIASVMESADYSPSEVQRVWLKASSSADFSIHRPVVATDEWATPAQ